MSIRFYIKFTVTGCGNFPFDMLRYDGCFPRAVEDAARMARPEYGSPDRSMPRSVTLVSYSNSAARPTIGRWQSFGWSVSNTELERM